MFDTENYKIIIVNSHTLSDAKLPYTVKVVLNCDNWEENFVKKCERDFRNTLSSNFGPHFGCHFDHYNMTATLNFRDSNTAAEFILMVN